LGIVIVEISQTKRSETELIEAKVELATGIAEEKINAENAAVIAENAKQNNNFVKYESRNTYTYECNYWIHKVVLKTDLTSKQKNI
jgi:hypothetical protein